MGFAQTLVCYFPNGNFYLKSLSNEPRWKRSFCSRCTVFRLLQGLPCHDSRFFCVLECNLSCIHVQAMRLCCFSGLHLLMRYHAVMVLHDRILCRSGYEQSVVVAS